VTPEKNSFLRLGVHWIRGKAPLKRLKSWVREFLPGDWKWEEREEFLHQRRHVLRGPYGVKIGFEEEGGRSLEPLLEFPGQACEVIGPACWALLKRFDWRDLNRVDLAFDGWTKDGEKLRPKDLYDMVEADRSSVRSRIDRDCVTMTCRVSGEQTVYFGSRESERFARVYNKREETRLELQLSGRYVQALGVCLWSGCNVKQWAFGVLRDHIDFVEAGESNISRATLQSWWASFVERWERCRVMAAKKVQTLDTCYQWLRSQVSAMLATLVRGSGGSVDFIFDLISEGESRMGARHSQLLCGVEGWSPGGMAATG
jgi:DNA relaxase NicK